MPQPGIQDKEIEAALDSMYYGHLQDGGPVYCETDMSQYIVEPYNAVSAFLFLGIVVYWFWKIRHALSGHGYMTFALATLAIGGIGGTLYHAFRSNPLYLYLDYVPILIISFTAGIYFLLKILDKWWYVLLILSGTFLLQRGIYYFFPPGMGINLSYLILAAFVLVPIFIFSSRTGFRKVRLVIFSMILFLLAIFFRFADMWQYRAVDICTHWLWHIFGAAATHFIVAYVYFSHAIKKDTRLNDRTDEINN